MKDFKTINVVPVTENVYNNIEAIYDKVLVINELLEKSRFADLELDLLYNMVNKIEFKELCYGLNFTRSINFSLSEYPGYKELMINDNINYYSYVNYFHKLITSYSNSTISDDKKEFINNYNTYNEIKIYKDVLFVKVDLDFFIMLKSFFNGNDKLIKKIFKIYLNTITNKVNIETEKLNNKTLTIYNNIYLKM